MVETDFKSPSSTDNPASLPYVSLLQKYRSILIYGTLVVLSAFFIISSLIRWLNPPPEPGLVDSDMLNPNLVIQLDVLNGNGISGIADNMVEFLRSKGFDVVEKGNYHSFNVANTMIIDRIGDQKAASVLAVVLGVDEDHIISQVSYEYFTDLTVVIGEDYRDLKAFQ